MFGQNTSISSSSFSNSNSRMFRVEIEGIAQTAGSTSVSYPIRNSGKTYLYVPYGRMNQEMQRINRLGGKILSIEPLTVDGNSETKQQATAAQKQQPAQPVSET